MGKIIKSFFGGAPKAAAPAPVAVARVTDLADEQSKQGKKARAALYGTEGGIQAKNSQPDKSVHGQRF